MDKNLEKVGIKTHQKVYDFLIQFFKDNGYAPSVREICVGTGLKSTYSVHHHLLVLADMGKIQMKENKTRAISLVGYEFRKTDK